MKDIIFRSATQKDIAQLVRLRILMLCETNGLTQNPSTPEFEVIVQSSFSESLQNQNYFGAVAELKGQIVSTNGVVLYRKPPTFKGPSGLVGYVTNVYTLPEFRKRGIASQLMQGLIAHAKQAGALKIHLGTTDDGKNLMSVSDSEM
jgi:GNAT superfamily N-acetyltransferase